MHIAMMIIISLLVDIVSCIVTGTVGMTCWNWFAPEVTSSAPQITFPVAIGLVIVCTAFISQNKQYSVKEILKNPQSTAINTIYSQSMNGVIHPLCILVLGWIVHSLAF